MLGPATLLDLDVVASWISGAQECERWAGWRVSFPIDREALPRAIEMTSDNAFTVVDREQLIAFGQLISKPNRRGHLARLIVSPAHRGRGYGELLVRALLDEARARFCDRASLNVDAANIPAVRLYTRMGFEDAPPPPGVMVIAGTRYMERSCAAKIG
jgi:ribosomal protein S18 acetylase RimI-like enzyme